MLPTDSDFIFLYIAYAAILAYLIYGLIASEQKKFYLINIIIFVIYSGIMMYYFSDPEYFKYGNSLAMLFYGGLFVGVHFIILAVIKFIRRGRKDSSI